MSDFEEFLTIKYFSHHCVRKWHLVKYLFLEEYIYTNLNTPSLNSTSLHSCSGAQELHNWPNSRSESKVLDFCWHWNYYTPIVRGLFHLVLFIQGILGMSNLLDKRCSLSKKLYVAFQYLIFGWTLSFSRYSLSTYYAESNVIAIRRIWRWVLSHRSSLSSMGDKIKNCKARHRVDDSTK